MLAVLIAALSHDVEEEDAALTGIDHVLERRNEQVGKRVSGWRRFRVRHGLIPPRPRRIKRRRVTILL
jgi:hypothetical protein